MLSDVQLNFGAPNHETKVVGDKSSGRWSSKLRPSFYCSTANGEARAEGMGSIAAKSSAGSPSLSRQG